MLNFKTEQRINLKFLVKLNKTSKEFFQALMEVYSEECMSRARIFDMQSLPKFPFRLERFAKCLNQFYQKFQVNSLLSFRVKHFSATATELFAAMSNLHSLQANVFFFDAQDNVLAI